jgi:hypothetical protein
MLAKLSSSRIMADLPGDRACRVRVVPRHHDHPDAGGAAFLDRRRHFGPRRVLEPDQPRQDEFLLPALARGVLGQRAGGKRQHPQSRRRHFLLCLHVLRADLASERPDAVGSEHAAAERQHRFRRALAVEHQAGRAGMHGGHAPAVGIERHFVAALAPRGRSGPLGHFHERHLHRVAEPARRAVLGHPAHVVAERGGLEQRGMPRHRGGLHLRGIPQPVAHEQAFHAHAVLGERPGLVRADDRGSAEGFHRWQMPDERFPPRHALRRHRERQRHRRQQTFRDVRDDDVDGKNEVLPEGEPEQPPDEEEHDAERGREHRHQA